MNQIWKYVLDPEKGVRGLPDAPMIHFSISMPAHSQVLCAQTQGEHICVWALVNPDSPQEQVVFDVFGTGHDCDVFGKTYVGTCQIRGLVLHVFRRSP